MIFQVHVLTKEIVFIGMVMLKFLPLKLVDKMTTTLGQLKHGNISKFGIQKPKHGPFYLKLKQKLVNRLPSMLAALTRSRPETSEYVCFIN